MQTIVAVAERMKQDLTMAIAAEQMFRPAASDNELIGCFNLGHAGDGFNLVRHSILFFQVMALMRLWDAEDDVRSIPTLACLLSDAGLVEKLVARERQATSDIRRVEMSLGGENEVELPFSFARSTPDQRERELRMNVSSWLQKVSNAKGHAEIASLRKHRNEIFAHSAGRSRLSRVRLPQYGDERKVLELTIPVVSKVSVSQPGLNMISRQPSLCGVLRNVICGGSYEARRAESGIRHPRGTMMI